MEIYRLNFLKVSLVLGLVIFQNINAQVGIGTTFPQGALDLASNSTGLIYPRIALLASNNKNPVVNPNGGNLAEGTVVYNTSLTTNGANDLFPGVYAWNGTKWKPQFEMEEYKKYEQTGGCQRTTIRQYLRNDPDPTDADNIAGLNNQVFSPKYSGIYKIEVRTNFSAGKINDFTSLDVISLATSEGAFFFKMIGPGVNINPASTWYDYTQGWMYTHSYSSYNSIESPAIENNIVEHNETLVLYKYLLANNAYTFNLSNCIHTGNDYFIGNGDTGDGQGHIGHDNPCLVEFTFIGD